MSAIEISKRLVLINSASSAVALILNLSVLVWLQQYLLKRISPEEYSLLPLLMAVMAFSPLLTMVLTGGLGRFTTIAYAKRDNEEITRICSTMFPLLLAAGVVFWAIGWFGAWHVDKLLDIPPKHLTDARVMMALLVFSAGLRLPLAVFGSGFIVRQKLMLQDLIDVGCQFLRIGLLFGLLLGIEARILWVTVALVVSELVNLAIATPISIRLVPAQKIRRGYLMWAKAKELTSYGGWGLLNQVSETFKQAMDPIILNRFASAVDVSVLYVAGIVPRQLRLMLTPISRPFIPVLAAFHATGDTVRLRNTYLRVARYHSWLLVCLVVPAIIFRHELIFLYLGGKYGAASEVMAILLLVSVLGGFNALGQGVAAAIGDMKGISVRMAAVQASNLGLTILFVTYLKQGAYGSAIATLLATAGIEATLVWMYCRKISHVSFILWVQEVILPSIVPALPSILLCLGLKVYVPIDSWTKLLVFSTMSGLLYLLMVVVSGLRQQDKVDIEKVAGILPKSAGIVLRYFVKK